MKKTPILAAALAAMLISASALYVQGDDLVYDSQSDPLVSLSYINDVVIAEYDKKISELTTKISDLTKENEELQSSIILASAKLESLEAKLSELQASPTASTYEIVYLKNGQKLLATETCELILRSGSAIVVSITTNGLNDLTSGSELLNTASAPLYHSLLVPRGNDGRGIQITSADAYVMVRGGYKIVD